MAKDLVDIVPDYDEKVGNMSATVLAARDAESAGYAHYMAKMLTASEAQREENRKLAEIRKKRHGIDPHAQQPSTQAIMARPKEKDLEHFLRPLPESVIEQSAKLASAHERGDMDAVRKLVAERSVTIEEVSHVEAIRRRPKNSTGQSGESGFTEERREAATNAYLCSPGIKFENLAPEDKQRISETKPYEQEPLIAASTTPKPAKQGWDFQGLSTRWSNFLYRLRNRK